jgi:hypothetical protein
MPLVLMISLAPALPAMAQQRVVVVPAGAEIVIPPRGADGPPVVRAPRPRIPAPGQPAAQAATRPMLESGGGSAGLGLAAPGLIVLPLLAAAYLAGTVPGNSSSSSTSAPARTR